MLSSVIQREYVKAQGYYEQALNMRRQLYPADRFPQGHADLAQSLQQSGSCPESSRGIRQGTGLLHEQALNMRLQLYPADRFPQGHVDLAQTLYNLGSPHGAQGERTARHRAITSRP